MTALLLLVLPVTGYLVGRWIEHACRPRRNKPVTIMVNAPVGDGSDMSAVINRALHEYLRRHPPGTLS